MISKKDIQRTVRVLLLLNLLAIDAGVFVADQALREVRDAACDSFDLQRTTAIKKAPPVPPEYGITLYPKSVGSYTLLDFNMQVIKPYDYQPGAAIGLPPMTYVQDTSLRLYGCDANGKRYRLWKSETIR